MARFKRLSRYTGGIVTKNRSEEDFLILRNLLNLPEDEGDIFVEVTQDLLKRPDLVATKAYNVPELWWAIYEFNGIRDPLFELTLGQVLRIPEIDRLEAAIEQLADR